MSTKLIQVSFPNKNGKYEYKKYLSNPPYQSIHIKDWHNIKDSLTSKLIYERLDWNKNNKKTEQYKWYINDHTFYMNLIRQKYPIWMHKSLYQIIEYEIPHNIPILN